MSGLFSTFNVATRGMYAQQKALDVTSHNIANANTEGYSRQRAKIETTRPFQMPSINSVAEPGQMGTGAQISAIERIRDSFLDYQVRTETSTLGQYSAREKYLTEMESIFNEPTDTGISDLLSSFYSSWQELSKNAESSNARTVVAQQSAALADELNHTYNQLQKLKTNAQDEIKSTVFDVNSLLDQIDTLNQQIKQVKVAGNMPNDLMDKRDLLLDQLSSKFNIKIEKTNFEGINVVAADGTSDVEDNTLVKSIQGGEKRFSYISDIKQVDATDKDFPKDFTITYYKLGDINNTATITLSNLSEEDYKKIDQNRVLWTNSDGEAIDDDGNVITSGDIDTINLFQPSDGELKGYQSIQKDVDEYISSLNNLAKALAFAVNAVHSGNNTVGADDMPFFVNSDVAAYDSDNKMTNLSGTDGIQESEQYITAGNISVNKEILYNVMNINAKTDENSGESDGARALAIAQIKDVLLKVQNIDSSTTRTSFVGTLSADGMTITSDTGGMKIENYFKDTIDELGVQSQEAQRIVTNQETLLSSFQESKDSVSGVSLDEEMANLVQYQHAYQANAKMISTIDELLDVVVNGLKK